MSHQNEKSNPNSIDFEKVAKINSPLDNLSQYQPINRISNPQPNIHPQQPNLRKKIQEFLKLPPQLVHTNRTQNLNTFTSFENSFQRLLTSLDYNRKIKDTNKSIIKPTNNSIKATKFVWFFFNYNIKHLNDTKTYQPFQTNIPQNSKTNNQIQREHLNRKTQRNKSPIPITDQRSIIKIPKDEEENMQQMINQDLINLKKVKEIKGILKMINKIYEIDTNKADKCIKFLINENEFKIRFNKSQRKVNSITITKGGEREKVFSNGSDICKILENLKNNLCKILTNK